MTVRATPGLPLGVGLADPVGDGEALGAPTSDAAGVRVSAVDDGHDEGVAHGCAVDELGCDAAGALEADACGSAVTAAEAVSDDVPIEVDALAVAKAGLHEGAAVPLVVGGAVGDAVCGFDGLGEPDAAADADGSSVADRDAVKELDAHIDGDARAETDVATAPKYTLIEPGPTALGAAMRTSDRPGGKGMIALTHVK